MRRKKVSFRAEPDVRVMDSYEGNDSSMELTTDFEKLVETDGMTDVLTDVLTDGLSSTHYKGGQNEGNEDVIQANTLRGDALTPNTLQDNTLTPNTLQDNTLLPLLTPNSLPLNTLLPLLTPNSLPFNTTPFNTTPFNTLPLQPSNTLPLLPLNPLQPSNTLPLLPLNPLQPSNTLPLLPLNPLQPSNTSPLLPLITPNPSLSTPNELPLNNVTQLLNTHDLRAFLPSSRTTLENVFKHYKIHFHDKAHFAKTRRETFTACILTPFTLVKSHFCDRHDFAHTHALADFLSSLNDERERRIEGLEVVLVVLGQKEVVGLKKWCREVALCEWYALKLAWQRRLEDVLSASKEELDGLLLSGTYEDDIKFLKMENENLKKTLALKKENKACTKREHIEDRIAVIKNYFNQRYMENYSTEQVDCMQFIARNIGYEQLRDNAGVLISMLDDQRAKKQSHYASSKRRKAELQEAIKKVERDLVVYEEKYSLKNIAEKDCDFIRRKYNLLLSMYKLQVIKVRKGEITLQFHDFLIRNGSVQARSDDIYEWGLKMVRRDRLSNTISDLLVLVCLTKEIGESVVYLNNGMLELAVNERVALVDMRFMKVVENEVVVYEGRRRDGMVKEFLNSK